MIEYEESTQERLTVMLSLFGSENRNRRKYASTMFKEMVDKSTFERCGSGEGIY